MAVTGSGTRTTICLLVGPRSAAGRGAVTDSVFQGSGGLSVTQALTLAQAAAQFSGGGGDDVFESLRKSLGVQGLDVSVGAEGGPTVGVSRAISDRVSVGVKAGASPEDTGVSVDIDVTRQIRVQGEIGAEGNTSIGVGAEWEY